MRTGRWDVWVYNEHSDLIVTSSALGTADEPFLKRDEEGAWKQAIHRGAMLAVGLEQPGPLVLRVLLGGSLSREEEGAWVDRWETVLHLPTGGLVISGDGNHVFGDGYPEFVQRLPQIPEGDYLAEVFTLLPGGNGVQAVGKVCQERIGGYFRRTRPGESFPTWLAKLCAESPKLDPGHEQEWRGRQVADDPKEYVAFILRLSPLVKPPSKLRLQGGIAPKVPLNPRLPDICPLGLKASKIIRPTTPLRGPLRLIHRIPVGDMIARLTPTRVKGGSAVVPAGDLPHLYRVASFCYRGPFPELRVEVPSSVTFEPNWPNASVGVRAERIEGGWRVAFEAMNWGQVRAILHVGPALATAPDGVVVELMTADEGTEDEEGRPGWHRYRGPIRAGRWEITHAYPPVSRKALLDAVELARQYAGGNAFRLRDDSEIAEVKRFAHLDSTLREAQAKNQLRFEGPIASVAAEEWFVREMLAMKIFRARFGGHWPIYTDDEADEEWNALMDRLSAESESRSPPAGALVLEGKSGKFYHTDGRPTDSEDAAEWDRKLSALGFTPLGRLMAERVRELTLLGYVLPDSPVYALVCLGGLAPASALDYYTTFENGASQTTTTNLFAGTDHPKWKIYREAFPNLSPAKLLLKHDERMPRLAKKHGPARPAEPTLLALAAAIDEFFVRYDA